MVCLRGQSWVLFFFRQYKPPFGYIIYRQGISFHFYAEDTQMYLPIRSTDTGMLNSISDCLCDIKSCKIIF